MELTIASHTSRIDKGLEQCLQQGLEQGRQRLQRGISRIIASRFGQVPARLTELLGEFDDGRLEELTVLAATVSSLEAFEAELQ